MICRQNDINRRRYNPGVVVFRNRHGRYFLFGQSGIAAVKGEGAIIINNQTVIGPQIGLFIE